MYMGTLFRCIYIHDITLITEPYETNHSFKRIKSLPFPSPCLSLFSTYNLEYLSSANVQILIIMGGTVSHKIC